MALSKRIAVVPCALVAASLLCAQAEGKAALSCEQLFAVVQASVRYRDQGYSLAQVLAALKEVEAENKLGKMELDVLQKAVSAAYLSQASPEEIALECVKSGAFGQAEKPARGGTGR